MRNGTWLVLIGLLAGLLFVPAGGGARAANASGCDVPHRTPAAILEIVGHGVAESTIDEPAPYVPSEGTPADSATAAQVRETVDLLVGCWNAGDILGFLSLLTDDFLARQAPEFEFTEEQLTKTEFVPPPANQRVAVREIRDVVVLADGRTDALVVIVEGGDEASPSAAVMTFVERDGRHLIDNWREVTLAETSPAWPIVHGPGYQGALVPLDQVAEFVRFLDGRAIQGTWLPDDAQIAALEAELPAFLARALGTRELAEPLADYGRQYAGFVAAGRAYILVNAFCDTTALDWTRQAVMVADGGSCFFQVTYEPASGAFTNLRVNGEA